MNQFKSFITKTFPLKEGPLLQSLYFWGLLFFVVGLLTQDYQKIPLTGGFVWITLMFLFSGNFSKKFQLLFQRREIFFILVFYALHLIALAVTDNSHEASRNISLKTALLLIPLSLGAIKEPINQFQKQTLLSVFVYGLFVMCLVDLSYATYRFIDTGDNKYFFYDQLPQVLHRKQHYMGWYLSVGIGVILWRLFGKYQFKKTLIKWFYVLMGIVFTTVILLLSTRAQILGIIGVFSTAALVYSYQKKMLVKGLLSLLSGLLLLGAALYIVPKTRQRIIETVDEWKEWKYKDGKKDTNVRVFIWKYGWEVFQENQWLGTGPGDANDDLHLKFEKCEELFWGGDRNFLLTEKNYNYHNQFLQSAASLGWIGAILLLCAFFRPFIFQRKNGLLLIFIGISFFGFMTESMLERQAGLLFFAFMYPFLYINLEATPERKDVLP